MNNNNENNLIPLLRFPEFVNDGEWDVKKLGEVAEKRVRKNKNVAVRDVFTNSANAGIVNQRDYFDKDIANQNNLEGYYVVEKDDFIYNPRISNAAPVGPISRNKIGVGVMSPLYSVFKFVEGNLDFIEHFFATNIWHKYMQDIGNNGARADRMSFSVADFYEMPILFPRLPEQQKIAACLSSLDEVITAESQKLQVLKEHKKGLLQNLFPQIGETVPKLRFKEFADDGDWVEKRLGEIAKIKSGSTPLRSNNLFYKDGNIHWVKTTDLNNSFIFDTEEKITELAKARINPEGSVLVAMYGGFNQIGRTGYLKIPAATNQALSVLNTNQKEVNPLFLLLWLNAKVDLWKTFAGSSRKDPNITGNDVAKFPISFPKLPEQQKIASCLSSIDEIINAQSQKVETLKLHKKGLLQGLFPGIRN